MPFNSAEFIVLGRNNRDKVYIKASTKRGIVEWEFQTQHNDSNTRD